MSQFCLNPACSNPRNSDQNQFCQGCGANLADSTQSYQFLFAVPNRESRA
ncbi:4-Cys prefix domain-containing protein [Xenococcus sp. PCC 7305]|nr:4-Cys prefix domain-containing protein [Xenococcus sp. PCC 7305]